MATNIRHKRSAVAGKQPLVSQLQSGELAINTADGKVFLLRDDNTVQDITQRIFDNDTQILVDDKGDSSQAQIKVDVNGFEKESMDFAGLITGSNYGLRYHEFISPMIKAIQELTDKVTQLEAQISGSNT